MNITYFFEDFSIQIPLLDVYNNGYHIGGKLNVTLDRFFTMKSLTDGLGHLSQSRLAAKHKYENRINMSDVFLRIGTVVYLLTFSLSRMARFVQRGIEETIKKRFSYKILISWSFCQIAV